MRLNGEIVLSSVLSSNDSLTSFYYLQLQCDLNCCCDLDCSEGALKAFKCELEGGRTIDDYNRDGLERCENDNGLLCVIDDSGGRDIKVRLPFGLEHEILIALLRFK